jgi:aminopeptidase-like protein
MSLENIPNTALDLETGAWMHALARTLWPIPRSLTGPGVRDSLALLAQELPGFTQHAVASGSEVLDWRVPDEWALEEAYVLDANGALIVHTRNSNLHVVGYSEPIDCTLPLETLQAHLHSLPEQPDAIPYVTSYYQRRWGICLSERQRQALKPGNYRVVIKTRHYAGELNYADCLIPGSCSEEVLLSSYICHPQMANNELSGPVLLTALGRWLQQAPRRYSYRLVLVPEMLGSIAYLHQHRSHLQRHTIAGFNLSCVGDERAYSYLPSRAENTLADRAALHTLRHLAPDFQRYRWLDRGSDESNYCAPGIDLPVASVMRSKYGAYPEYHTSLDDLDKVVTARGLAQSYRLYQHLLCGLELNRKVRTRVLGEPQLGRRGLYPSLSTKHSTRNVRGMLDLISYADGSLDLLAIAERCERPIWELAQHLPALIAQNVLEYVDE